MSTCRQRPPAHSKLPVFLWIHGGALVTGTGADYDPSVMVAENNIVVVTINYRLGALGWLVEPGLLAETQIFPERRRRRQLRPDGSAIRHAMGAAQYRRFWRRCKESDHRRRIRRRSQCLEQSSVDHHCRLVCFAARSSRAAPTCCTTCPSEAVYGANLRPRLR